MSAPERRTTPRLRIRAGSFAYYALGYGAIRDLSLGGVFIEDHLNPVPEGTKLVLELRLGNESISLRGVVRRCFPKVGFAVQFLEVPSDTKEHLERYFRTHLGSADLQGEKQSSSALKSAAPAQPWRIPRKHPRVRLVAQVECRATGATCLGRTDNIGVGGLLLHSRETFDPRTEVIVRFNLPPGHPVEAQGVVAHALPGIRMGIQFLQLKDDDRKAIAEFIQKG